MYTAEQVSICGFHAKDNARTLACSVVTCIAFGITYAVIRFSIVTTSANGIVNCMAIESAIAPRSNFGDLRTVVTQPNIFALKERWCSEMYRRP